MWLLRGNSDFSILKIQISDKFLHAISLYCRYEKKFSLKYYLDIPLKLLDQIAAMSSDVPS